jgi:hypothetical protein
MQPFCYERPTSEIILTGPIYRLVAGGETSPWAKPPVISPPVVIFRRIGVRAEVRTQNPVLSNTGLAKMVPLSHLRRRPGACFAERYTLTLTGCPSDTPTFLPGSFPGGLRKPSIMWSVVEFLVQLPVSRMMLTVTR